MLVLKSNPNKTNSLEQRRKLVKATMAVVTNLGREFPIELDDDLSGWPCPEVVIGMKVFGEICSYKPLDIKILPGDGRAAWVRVLGQVLLEDNMVKLVTGKIPQGPTPPEYLGVWALPS